MALKFFGQLKRTKAISMDKSLSNGPLHTNRSKSSTMCSEVMGRLSGRKLMMELNTLVVLVEPAPLVASSGVPSRAAVDNAALGAPPMPLWMCLPTLFIARIPEANSPTEQLVSWQFELWILDVYTYIYIYIFFNLHIMQVKLKFMEGKLILRPVKGSLCWAFGLTGAKLDSEKNVGVSWKSVNKYVLTPINNLKLIWVFFCLIVYVSAQTTLKYKPVPPIPSYIWSLLVVVVVMMLIWWCFLPPHTSDSWSCCWVFCMAFFCRSPHQGQVRVSLWPLTCSRRQRNEVNKRSRTFECALYNGIEWRRWLSFFYNFVCFLDCQYVLYLITDKIYIDRWLPTALSHL